MSGTPLIFLGFPGSSGALLLGWAGREEDGGFILKAGGFVRGSLGSYLDMIGGALILVQWGIEVKVENWIVNAGGCCESCRALCAIRRGCKLGRNGLPFFAWALEAWW